MSLVRNDHNGTKLLWYDMTWVRNDRLPCNTSVFTGLNHFQQSLTYRMPQTMNKYMCTYVILVGCSLVLPIYYTYTNYSLEVGGQNEATGEVLSNNTIFNTVASIQYGSVGEVGLIKIVEVVAENASKLQSTALLHRRVDPRTSNTDQTDQLLRDSIEIFHSNKFIKPPNEVCEKRPPSAIVIGVAKSGTRELMDFMHLHPHIQIYYKKTGQITYEMNYFAKQQSEGTRRLTEQMPCSFSNQMTIMKHSGYFHLDNVPERIRKFNASIRLILVVREPIARSYSAYTFEGLYEESFDKVVMKALKNKKQKLYSRLLNMSIYDESMERWLKVFNLSQILIIEHNEFKHDPVSVLVKVEKFLGLGHYTSSDMFAYNAVTGFKCIRSNLTTTGMSCYASNRGRPQNPISREIKSKLTDYFKPKNERFFRMIGKSFDW